jgi:hypothetical protein
MTAINILVSYENTQNPDLRTEAMAPWNDSVTREERGASEPSHGEGNHKVSPF